MRIYGKFVRATISIILILVVSLLYSTGFGYGPGSYVYYAMFVCTIFHVLIPFITRHSWISLTKKMIASGVLSGVLIFIFISYVLSLDAEMVHFTDDLPLLAASFLILFVSILSVSILLSRKE